MVSDPEPSEAKSLGIETLANRCEALRHFLKGLTKEFPGLAGLVQPRHFEKDQAQADLR